MVYIRNFRAASWSYIIEKNLSQRTKKKKSKGKKIVTNAVELGYSFPGKGYCLLISHT